MYKQIVCLFSFDFRINTNETETRPKMNSIITMQTAGM